MARCSIVPAFSGPILFRQKGPVPTPMRETRTPVRPRTTFGIPMSSSGGRPPKAAHSQERT